MNEVHTANKFKELREKLFHLKYKVDKDCFEILCYLHDFLTKNKGNLELKNELMDILHDIFIEIFMPLQHGEAYRKYGNDDENKRFYFGPANKLSDEIKYIYDLNVFSKVWLKDISAFYQVRTDNLYFYNFKTVTPPKFKRGTERHSSKKEEFPSQSQIRGIITKHLQEYIDPDKPIKPNTYHSFDNYKYEFLNALYEENKVKNRFFQEMKYQLFRELAYKKYCLLNLKAINYYPIKEYNDIEEETISWIVKLSPIDNEYLSKYNLFKDNPFVYFYRYQYKDEINNNSFTPATAEYIGKVVSIDDDKNIITIKINADEFSVSKYKYLNSIVLRQDYITYQREKQAIIEFVDRKDNLSLRNFLINLEVPEEFYDVTITDFCNNNLNPSQKLSVENALRAKEFFSIHGPPGTGKTKVCSEIIVQTLKFNPNSRILVTCASNEATDNILNSLVKILPEELQPIILRIGTEEKTADNLYSLSYKVENSHLFNDKILRLQKKKENNNKDIKKCQETIKKIKPEYEEIISNKEKEELKLLNIKDKGTRNEKRTGIVSEIDQLRNIRPANEEEVNKIVAKLKELELEKNRCDFEINKLNSDCQKLQQRISENNQTLNLIYEENKSIDLELKINEKQLKDTVINRKPIVVFSTNNHSALLSKYNSQKFDLLLIDEITQSTEPSALIPINISKKVIIAGDHHQLPPTVFLKNKDYEEELNPESEKERIHCYQILSTSLFERLYDKIKNNPNCCIFLDTQYRMNPVIIKFLNDTIYKLSNLKSDDSTNYNSLKNGLFGLPIVFINHDEPENKEYASEEFAASKVEYSNEREIEIILKIVQKYLNSGFSSKNLGLISPYKSQVRKLNKVVEPLGLVARTIDSFQGQEKEIIILSLVRSNNALDISHKKKIAIRRIGFLVDERRFNVGITRFKSKLIIIGNEDTITLSNDSSQEYYDVYENKNKPLYYKSLIDFIKHNGKFISNTDMDSYLKNDKLISLVNENKNNTTALNKDFQRLLLKQFYEVIIEGLKQEIKTIKRDTSLSYEKKVEAISDKITISLSQLKEPRPLNERLSRLSKTYIKTADILYDSLTEATDSEELDWGSIINNYGRALEEELLRSIFVPFKDRILSIENSTEEIIKLKKDDNFKMLVEFILKDKKLAIGNMEHLLNTVINSTTRSELFLVKFFRDFLQSLKNQGFIFGKYGLCDKLRKSTEYRNPSSHTGRIINHDFCDEAMLSIKQIITELLDATSPQ